MIEAVFRTVVVPGALTETSIGYVPAGVPAGARTVSVLVVPIGRCRVTRIFGIRGVIFACHPAGADAVTRGAISRGAWATTSIWNVACCAVADPAGRAALAGRMVASTWVRLSAGALLTDGGCAAAEVPHDDGVAPRVWVRVPPPATADQVSQFFATVAPLSLTRWM